MKWLLSCVPQFPASFPCTKFTDTSLCTYRNRIYSKTVPFILWNYQWDRTKYGWITFPRLRNLPPKTSTECERVSHFFHILGSVEQPKGINIKGKDLYKYTLYSSCCNTDKRIYYYKTYDNHQITAIDMNRETLDSKYLISYPLIKDCYVRIQNQ